MYKHSLNHIELTMPLASQQWRFRSGRSLVLDEGLQNTVNDGMDRGGPVFLERLTITCITVTMGDHVNDRSS